MEEMGKDIARFTEEGQVVVAGDWNCKIGRLMSVAREMEYNSEIRQSESMAEVDG